MENRNISLWINIQSHLEEFVKSHGGEWVVIAGGQLIGFTCKIKLSNLIFHPSGVVFQKTQSLLEFGNVPVDRDYRGVKDYTFSLRTLCSLWQKKEL